ncbi:MAG: Uma2 family endonuclease [Acaryochloridaceae cyanobacterium RL_2_7]|nr:Uma2 family endonuclease [Acaryochloridaceae cyanobacterium RL_2_7]
MDQWIATPWAEYVSHSEDPTYQRAKGYYFLGSMRLEMQPVGFDHSTDHSLLSLAINLYGMVHGLPLVIADSCSYRKVGLRECQPDLSVYVGESIRQIPKATNIVDLDVYPAPNIAIEISKTTLLDDLGAKRSLYEQIGIQEYWVVDVEQSKIIAYTMNPQGSTQIQVSSILEHLSFSTLELALTQGQTQDHSQIGSWLLQEFQQLNP